MINFSKRSRPASPAEREADEQRRAAEEIASDRNRRQEWSRRTVALTLDRDPECRHSFSGDQCLHLHGTQDDGKTISAAWYAPSHFARDQVDGVFEKLVVGVGLTLDGYWKPYELRGQTRFTFIAQFIRFDDGARVP
jgi:hypothetical protein